MDKMIIFVRPLRVLKSKNFELENILFTQIYFIF
jgi:hypothetical protein